MVLIADRLAALVVRGDQRWREIRVMHIHLPGVQTLHRCFLPFYHALEPSLVRHQLPVAGDGERPCDILSVPETAFRLLLLGNADAVLKTAVAASQRIGVIVVADRGLRAVDGVDDRLVVSGRQRVAQIVSDEGSLVM